MHVVIIVHKNSQLKQKRCQNDERLWRYGSSKIIINLIQREIISKSKTLGCFLVHLISRFCFFKVVFCLFVDVSDSRLTPKVSCFDE